jgi:hypothetical protein
MEIGKGLVYPHQALLDEVKVDMVHENMKNMTLEVPPDDTTLTMWDVITIRV